MCGLAGIFHAAPVGIDANLLRRMTTALSHRGPDGEGFHLEPGLGLGHRRLAIIDIEGGHQPMFNEDGSVAVVFNGEIYNHADLRPELEAAGHVFQSRCDTEVILHAWEEWGVGALTRFSGMFAIALWDRNRGTLLLARDHLGKKPLYYGYRPDGALVFASELAALAAVPDLSRRIDAAAVEDFFALGYIPDPASIFEGIRKLPPAHYLLATRTETARRAPARYWSLARETAMIGAREAEAALLGHLDRAVATRLIADVPLGAFLSGGIDSSAVVARAAVRRTAPLDTFTIGFPGTDDERPYAALMAARYHTNHHTDATEIDYIAAARTQARLFGEPFGDHSSVPTRDVCALARRHVTVALSGDGGDEVLGGYRRYRFHVVAEAVRRLLPAPLRRHALAPLARLYPKLDRAPRWLRAKHTLTEISLDSALGYYRTLAKVQDERRRALLSPGLRARIDGHDPATRILALMAEREDAAPLAQAQYVDINTYLPGDILVKVDRASMAVSLEARAPLLDRDLVAFGFSLPARLKLRGGSGKDVLKRALAPYVPGEILYRRKQGFAMPLAEQFRAGADRVHARLMGEAMLDSGLFQPDALSRLVREHETRRFDHSTTLWLLLVFEGFLAREAGLADADSPQMAAGGFR
jgi:asparagine synthase (glutamine-hydrolysing)